MEKDKSQPSAYPEVITSLPEAEIPFEGAKAWILQADTQQLVFFEFEADIKLPPHSHIYPQWGMVIEGEMELIIDGKRRFCKKGTEYLVPAGTKHSVKFIRKTRLMDFFSEKERYKQKTHLKK